MNIRRYLLMALITVVGCDKDSSEKHSLTGTWAAFRIDANPAYLNYTWTFSDTAVSIFYFGNTFSGPYTYDQDKNPARLDITFNEPVFFPPPIDYPNKAVYKFLNADTLIIKVTDGAAQRANNFDVVPDYDVFELSRQPE